MSTAIFDYFRNKFTRGYESSEQPAAPIPHPIEPVAVIPEHPAHTLEYLHWLAGEAEAALQHLRPEATMATLATLTEQTPAAPAAPVAGHVSFLSHFGSVLRRILHISEEVAIVASPFVGASFPAVGGLFNTAIGLALTAEATAVHATGTGTQKLAVVATGIAPAALDFVQKNNLAPWSADSQKRFSDLIAQALNEIPAAQAAVAAASTK